MHRHVKDLFDSSNVSGAGAAHDNIDRVLLSEAIYRQRQFCIVTALLRTVTFLTTFSDDRVIKMCLY